MGAISGALIAAAQMFEQGFGHIVSTASLLDLDLLISSTPYAVTRHAAVGYRLFPRLPCITHKQNMAFMKVFRCKVRKE
jgi:hypothetical protein